MQYFEDWLFTSDDEIGPLDNFEQGGRSAKHTSHNL